MKRPFINLRILIPFIFGVSADSSRDYSRGRWMTIKNIARDIYLEITSINYEALQSLEYKNVGEEVFILEGGFWKVKDFILILDIGRGTQKLIIYKKDGSQKEFVEEIDYKGDSSMNIVELINYYNYLKK